MFPSGSYAWDTRAVRVVRSADSTTTCSSPAPHTSDNRADEVGDEDIVEVSVDPVDEDLHEKEISALPFHPRK